ncbi:DUF4352 domain-containing protein [Streptomyces cinerochromogenes]|uniref:DUF4352 domain-containing protein n=1 Tax=Streptomyces cinerochromogenes TaxID=66422 RepID=UPI003674FACC
MRAYIRRAVVPAAVLSAVVLTGCSSGSGNKAAPSTPSATQEATQAPDVASPTPSQSTSSAPVLSVGQTGTYEVGETDEYGENYKVTGKMSVTVVSAKYVTPAEVGTTNKPKGQYVELTLTIKNVGKSTADFNASAMGRMMWEDEHTARQDATTLADVAGGPDLDTTYEPGQSLTGKTLVDVPHRDGVVSYMGSDDPQHEGPTFSIRLPTA